MTMKNRHKVFGILQHVVLIILAVYTLAPLAFLVVNAFKSNIFRNFVDCASFFFCCMGNGPE